MQQCSAVKRVKCFPLHCSVVQLGGVLCSTVQHCGVKSVLCSTVQRFGVQSVLCSTAQLCAAKCSVVQFYAIQCSVDQQSVVQSAVQYSSVLFSVQCNVVQYNALLFTRMPCCAIQCSVVHWSALHYKFRMQCSIANIIRSPGFVLLLQNRAIWEDSLENREIQTHKIIHKQKAAHGMLLIPLEFRCSLASRCGV